jgi:emfourin
MRITLTRSGGFAGLLPPPVTLDTAALPRGVASRIEELVASADFFNLPRTVAAPIRQPDRLQFTVRIVNDDGPEHTVTCDEEAASAPFLELVRAVQKATRR